MRFAEELARLSERCGLEPRLRDVGIPADAIERLASDAMNQTRLLVNNPRPLNENDARSIYQAPGKQDYFKLTKLGIATSQNQDPAET